MPPRPSSLKGLAVYIPRRRLFRSAGGSWLSRGAERPAACGGLPLTACPGCAIPCGATGVYPPEPPPFPRMGKGGGIGLTRTPEM